MLEFMFMLSIKSLGVAHVGDVAHLRHGIDKGLDAQRASLVPHDLVG